MKDPTIISITFNVILVLLLIMSSTESSYHQALYREQNRYVEKLEITIQEFKNGEIKPGIKCEK